MTAFASAPSPWGNFTYLDIAAPTVVKTGPGVAITVQVITAGSAAGAVYDSASTSGNTVANQVASIPAAAGIYSVQMPCLNGIVVSPGTSQVLAISYS